MMEVTASCQNIEKNKEHGVVYIEPTSKIQNRRAYLIPKRVFDFFFALIGLIALAIPMMIIAVIIVLDSPGKPFFSQKRMGKDGKIFTIFKFRTMYKCAPSDVATNSINTVEYTTKVGNFLRLHSLDELPQLWNVLKGDMSFVGYRPVCLTEERLNRLRAEYGILTTRPGITGYAQVNGRDTITTDEKVKMDLYYVEHRSILFDLRCLLKTVKVALTKEGAN